MISKFTPGPWEWWTSNSWRRLRAKDITQSYSEVAYPTTSKADGHPDIVISEADMRLIAAAPEMYELLLTLIDDSDSYGAKWDRSEARHKAYALLARIDGDG